MDNIFDRYSKEYDDWYEKNKFAYLSELEAIKKVMPDKGRGLEIGVGSGRFASALGIDIGIDSSPQMIEKARKRGLKVKLAQGENLPFNDGEFDYVLIITTLCFVREPRKVIAEASRVLKNRGRLIVGIIDKNSSLGKRYQTKKSRFYKKAKFFLVNEVVNLLKEAGLGKISLKQTLFHPPDELSQIEPSQDGDGKGAFVVISACK